MDVQHKKVRAATWSVISNTCLVLAKVFVGLMIGSVSVLSEAIHSAVDLLASGIALVAVRTSSTPADEKHPFGHGKIENLSGLAEALLIFLAAGWIIREAVHKLTQASAVESVGWGVLVMAISAVVNWAISSYLFRMARETDSMALEADAWHLRTDVYTSAGVMIGLTLMGLGGLLFPGRSLHWVDPVTAIAVALLIVKAAWELTSEAIADLLDRRIAPEEEQRVVQIIGGHPAIRSHHGLRTRKAGSNRFVDVHLQVDGSTSLTEAHAAAMEVTRAIEKEIPGTRVITHVEPAEVRVVEEVMAESKA